MAIIRYRSFMGVAAAVRINARVYQVLSAELERSKVDPPEILYHYTTQEGLLGIVQSSSLFLSDARFVNDRSEVSYGRGLFADRLLAHVEASGTDVHRRVWTHFSSAVETGRRRQQESASGQPAASNDHFYMTSLCTDGNLLSQWRGYGIAANGGCSIGFRSADLVAGASVPGHPQQAGSAPIVRLQQVLYDPVLQNQFIDQVISSVFSVLDGSPTAINDAQYVALMIDYAVIPVIASYVKAPTFREEQEWRLVSRC